jgi:hypothetical protein
MAGGSRNAAHDAGRSGCAVMARELARRAADHAVGVTTAHSARVNTERHVDDPLRRDPRTMAPRQRGGAMIAPAQLAAFWSRMADLDEEIAATHAEGYCVDGVHDDRLEWQRERKEPMDLCTRT